MATARRDPLFPKMDPSSAVFPTVRVDGDVLHLAYHLPRCTDSAVVTFKGVSAWSYGEPSDERLQTHPLWGHGLAFYEFHEIVSGENRKRWVATFHDGTLEVSAMGAPSILAARVEGCSPVEALNSVLGPGENKVLDAVA